jgi:hypothetical protein
MAFAKYNVLREKVKVNDVEYGRGQELILDTGEGQRLVENGDLNVVRFLNNEDEKDKLIIEKHRETAVQREKDEIARQENEDKRNSDDADEDNGNQPVGPTPQPLKEIDSVAGKPEDETSKHPHRPSRATAKRE